MSIELFPFSDYAQAECERVKNTLPEKKPGDVRFAFIADFHYKYMKPMRAMISNIIHTLNELNKVQKIDFVCFGGDNVGNYPNSREEHIDMMQELADYLKHCEVPVIFVQGNHDDNSIHGEIAPETHKCKTGFEVPDAVQYDVLFANAEQYSNHHPAGDKKLYSYMDIEGTDTRVVFLDTSDVPYIVDADGMMKYNQQWDFGYSGEQLRWLAETALKNAPKNVLILQHASTKVDYFFTEALENEEYLNAILNAFMNGEKIHISRDHEDFGFDITADFTGESHRIPAKIAGHCHADRAYVAPDGFLNITTMLAGRKNSGMHAGDNGIIYERELFCDKETAVDIFTFSPSEYTLEATRYGSGENRKFNI